MRDIYSELALRCNFKKILTFSARMLADIISRKYYLCGKVFYTNCLKIYVILGKYFYGNIFCTSYLKILSQGNIIFVATFSVRVAHPLESIGKAESIS